MYPHERSLVQKYQPDQFSILGVNSDKKEKLKRLLADKTITWPCLAEDGIGALSTSWRVWGWPTIYIIDQKGKIRFKSYNNDTSQIEPEIDALLHHLKQSKQKKAAE
jgi:peroxiredoxin